MTKFFSIEMAVAVTRSAIGRAHGSCDVQIMFAHCTSLCKEIWNPVLEELSPLLSARELRADAVLFDFYGHGDSGQIAIESAAEDALWSKFCPANICEALGIIGRQQATIPLVGVGHSMGGAGMVYAEAAMRDTFQSLILYEPIIFHREQIEQASAGPNVLAAQASKRRSSWPSRKDAYDSLRNRGIFKKFTQECFEEYLYHGLTISHDGRWRRWESHLRRPN